MALPNTNSLKSSVKRVRIWYAFLVVVLGIFGIRLFYVQVIRFDHYKKAALNEQLQQYKIPAERGIIEAHSGDQLLPIVLNQNLYTLYADPTYVKNPDAVAGKMVAVFGGKFDDYKKLLLTKHTRYVILAKKVTPDQRKNILSNKYRGVGATEQPYRVYPQGSLAAQTLGFVSDGGRGEYGIEQALDEPLKGVPGDLKAITDASGVPLAASKDNIQTSPKNGKTVVLTLDLAIQQQLETILAAGVKNAKADSGSALIIDPYSGAIKAMANVPTFDPAQYFNVENGTTFQNAVAAKPIEIGSIMKTLTTAAALDQGVINPGTSYNDPSFWKVNGFKITNIEEDGGAGVRTIGDILNLSLNTGATWELMQMGGGQINDKARTTWHDYMVNRYRFSKPTGIEQGYEEPGSVPDAADNGAGINLTYANTSFGQAMTATPVQVAGAMSAVLNGGTYFQPHVVDQTIEADGAVVPQKPKVLQTNVVSAKVSQQMIPLMQYVVDHHNIVPAFDQGKYIVGGKTGTAQIAKKGGGYYDDQFNGTYVGFVGGEKAQYVIVVFIEKPKNGGYAGTAAAQPVFANLAHMLINDSYVTPKRQ